MSEYQGPLASLVRSGPDQYINEPGSAKDPAALASDWRHPAVITGKHARSAYETYAGGPVPATVLVYDGSVTDRNARELADALTPDTDVVVALGGGRAIDTAKEVAHLRTLPLVVVPTIASTCAPYSALSVIYDERHAFLKVSHHPRNAVKLVVDPALIARAPRQYLLGGIGDTLAKWYEAKAVFDISRPHSALDRLGLEAARIARDELLEQSTTVLEHYDDGHGDHAALGNLIDTIIALGGAVGGFARTKGRASGAHAIHDALTIIPESHVTLHGLKVAYGILVQLTYVGEIEQVEELSEVYRRIGLPTSLRDMGVPASAIDRIATRAAEPDLSWVNAFPHATSAGIANAIRQLESV